MQPVRLLLSFSVSGKKEAVLGMEKAVHISNLKNLKYFNKEDYQRIYWGAEFCQNLISDLKDTDKALAFAAKNASGFSFITPLVTDSGLKKLNKAFSYLRKNNVKCEIIVNDWGVLGCLHAKFNKCFKLALGRLLVRQQRDPSMRTVFEEQSPYAVRDKNTGKLSVIIHRPPGGLYQKGMRASYINSSLLQDFLSRFGIERIELNNVIQGLYLEGIRFKKSIYTPYVNISTTRFCPMESRAQKLYRIDMCYKECQGHYYEMHSRNIPMVIYKRGNTTFYKNPLDIRSLGKNGIDRIVIQPELPF